MADLFELFKTGLSSPCDSATEITPSDSVDLTSASRAVYIGGVGDLKVTTVQGDTVTFKSLIPGSVLPVRVVRIFATGTTATNIVAIS